MQLVCNGVTLDLSVGARMMFQKTNPLFAFDALACERTQSFTLPSTPTNERVLGLAKIPAYAGGGMRCKFACELQDGTLVLRGYLYVEAWQKDAYKAIFVGGELLGLKRIAEAGKLSDVLTVDEAIRLEQTGYKDANDMTQQDFDRVLYARREGRVLPSINLKSIADRAADTLGFGIDYGTAFDDEAKYRVLPARCSIRNKWLTLTNTNGDAKTELGIVKTHGALVERWRCIAQRSEGGRLEFVPLQQTGTDQYQQWVCNDYDLSVEFSDEFPTTFFLVSGNANQTTEIGSGTRFLGGWGMVGDGTGVSFHTYGEPLAGRKVEIPRGTPFGFLTSAWYECPAVAEFGQEYVIGYNIPMEYEVAHRVALSTTSKLEDGLLVPYNGILPDVTVVELLKTMAAISGTSLLYRETRNGGVVVFDDISEFAGVKEIGAQDERNVSRTFMDYARTNRVRFDSTDDVLPSQRLGVEYTIDNDNLAEDKTLITMFASEGGTHGGSLYVDNDGKMYEMGKPTVVRSYTDTETYMQRVGVKKNATIQRLCDASTTVELTTRMTLEEYERMDAKTVLLYAGTRYVWTSAQWQDGAARLTLAKI